ETPLVPATTAVSDLRPAGTEVVPRLHGSVRPRALSYSNDTRVASFDWPVGRPGDTRAGGPEDHDAGIARRGHGTQKSSRRGASESVRALRRADRFRAVRPQG